MRLASDDEGVIPLLLGLGVIAIVSLFLMAFAPEYFIVGLIVLFGLVIWIGIVKLGATPGQTLITKRTVVVGVVILLVCILLASMFLMGFLKFEIGAPGDINDYKTREYKHWGWRGKGIFQDGNEPKELLDDHFYIASWLDEVESEKIVIEGRLECEETICGQVWEIEYKVKAWDGDSWELVEKFKNVPFGREWEDITTIESRKYTIDSNYEGWIKVELHALIGGALNKNWNEMAEDVAEIADGKGKLKFEDGLYQIGDNARLKLILGHAEGKYWLEIEALTPGVMIYEGFVPESLEGRTVWYPDDFSGESFKIKSEYFATGAWPDCPDNMIEARLWNQFYQTGEAWTATTDLESLSPGKPKIDLSDPADGEAYRTGEQISITLSADPNLETQIDIKEYWLGISPGDIVKENTGGAFTFQPPHKGKYTISYSCQDAVCRRSEVGTKEITVYDTGEKPKIEFGDEDWLPIILIIIATVIALGIAYFVAKDHFKTSNTKALIVGGVVAIVVLILGLLWIGAI